jgi:hypothetical protein
MDANLQQKQQKNAFYKAILRNFRLKGWGCFFPD